MKTNRTAGRGRTTIQAPIVTDEEVSQERALRASIGGGINLKARDVTQYTWETTAALRPGRRTVPVPPGFAIPEGL